MSIGKLGLKVLLFWVVLLSMVRIACGEQASAGSPKSSKDDQFEAVKDPTKLAIRMMEEVKRRQEELKIREEEIRRREEILRTLEKDLQRTVEELENKHQELMALEQRLSQEEEARLDQLAKVFESAPPEQGGRLLTELDSNTAAKVLERMNSRKAGRLWGYVEPQKAAAISEILTKSHEE